MLTVSPPNGWLRAVFSFFMVLIISGAIYSGYLFFSTVRAVVARTTTIPFIENVSASPGTIPGRAPQQELPNLAQKKERVNILLLGIDQRDNDPGPYRTDTMILASLDPATNSAVMLSIPRDLWVNIPGYGEDRINTAHATGDVRKYPGGGVALAKKTVWYTLGVPVHYYVRINFVGFEKLVDAIGGVTINVEKAIHDTEYPDNAYGTFVLDIPAGVQQMDGVRTLQYARTRHGSSDFDRMARQRAVITAASDKLLSVDTLAHIPQLLQIAGDTVKTDLTLDEMIALANIAKQLDRSRLRSASVDQSITATVVTPQGAMVEVPDWDKLRKLLDDLFPPAIITAAATPNLIKTQLAAEEVRIELQNGTLVTDLAKNTAERLREKGLNVVLYGDAERLDHAETLIVPYTDKRYTVEALASQLAVRPENIRRANNGKPGVDVLIILGQDYAQQVARQ